MSRTTFYVLWVVAFFLKVVGASWDASYHFKYFRELTQAPHIVNVVGLLIACLLFVYMWRHEPKKWRRPFKTIGLGVLIYFSAIPLDELYHRVHGIDLTTWSPTHFLLYIGTLFMIIGVIMQVLSDRRSGKITETQKKIFLGLLSFFLLENVWFPLLQQEQGAIADYFIKIGMPEAGPDLLAMVAASKAEVYGGAPAWLYAVYISFVTLLLFPIVEKLKIHRYALCFIALGYVTYRVIADSVISLAQYPTSTVPYFLLIAAVLFEIVYRHFDDKKLAPLGALLGGLGIVVVIQTLGLITTDFPIHPPIPWIGFSLGIGAVLLGYATSLLFARVLFPGRSK